LSATSEFNINKIKKSIELEHLSINEQIKFRELNSFDFKFEVLSADIKSFAKF
jgi:hypothetical protein